MQITENSKSNFDGSLGVFTVVALVLILWGFCWYKNYSPLQKYQQIKVMFPQVAGLNENANVLVDGVRAGTVEKIEWHGAENVLVLLRVSEQKVWIPIGSRFNIRANGIIGAKYVDIKLPIPNPDAPSSPIDENIIVVGERPVRPEVVLEKINADLDQLDIERIEKAIKEDRQTLRRTANQISNLVDKAVPVLDRAVPLENEISLLSIDLRNTVRKLNSFCDNPKLSNSLKETVDKLQSAAKSAQSAIHELNATMHDDSVQTNLNNNLSQFKESTKNIEESVKTLRQISEDEQLRADMKQITTDTRKSVETLDEIFQTPTSNSNVKKTLSRAITTLSNIDLVARQLNQILNKRHPLMQMLIGRPGYIKTEETQTEIHTEIK